MKPLYTGSYDWGLEREANFSGINRSAEYDSAIITGIKFDGINIIINKCSTAVLNDVLGGVESVLDW